MQELDPILQQMPGWADNVQAITPLSEGITNRNYKVTVGDEAFVVRLCAPGMGVHGIDRQVEQVCARAAAQIGVAPPVLAFLDKLPGDQEAMISRFIAGRTLGAAEVRASATLPAVVATMHRYHALTTYAGRFDVFRIFASGLAAAQQMHAPLPPFMDQVQGKMQRIEQALQRKPLPLVACHNDLLPANFLLDEQQRLWLLDWEYAGWGDPFFDLGNLSVNNEFSDDDDAALLTHYFGAQTAEHWARLKLMKIVSDAREGIWGMVQWGLSTLDFDYADYGNRHLARFMENCGSPAVAGWLETLQDETRHDK